MAGNSLRSDILPALAAGALAAHIPYPLTWTHEHADPPIDDQRFGQLDSIVDLPGWLGTQESNERCDSDLSRR
jgi:putative hydrolase of the HAD superfamily